MRCVSYGLSEQSLHVPPSLGPSPMRFNHLLVYPVLARILGWTYVFHLDFEGISLLPRSGKYYCWEVRCHSNA